MDYGSPLPLSGGRSLLRIFEMQRLAWRVPPRALNGADHWHRAPIPALSFPTNGIANASQRGDNRVAIFFAVLYPAVMPAASKHSASRVLKSTAWDARVDAVLLRKAHWRKEAEKADIARSHTHTLRRLFEDPALALDAVLCLDRRPTLCVLDARGRDDADIERVRRRLWNLGATTLLLAETPTDVRLYSTLAKPSRQDERGAGAQLADETIADLETAVLARQLTQLIRRVETGAIYRDYTPRFDPAQAVDRGLLDNLKTARDVLCPKGTPAELQQAHRLIGRFLFSCYLLDRGIVGPPYLAAKNLPEANDMQGLLTASLLPASALEQLFTALHRDFNGSLFGEPFSPGSIRDKDVDVLLRLLAGENLRTGQLHLPFKLYDFSYVPVELISSIYEEFLGAEAAAAATPTGRNQPGRNAQRASGAYYTPPRLAELTVDIATEGWDTLLDKRCLDPACGSGIFLVILFVRMAEEWRLRNPDSAKEPKALYEGLLKLLENNLHGVDIQLTACLVTCFSLYLAFLDQMEPKEIRELREELERAANAKILPRILWERGQEKPRARDRHFPTVREFDFFEMETGAQFHLVIGNPPWVSRKPAPHIEAWLYSEKNPHAKLLGWTTKLEEPTSTQKKTLFPAREHAAAFMWKASLHTLPDGRVCQVMPSRVLLSNNTDAFQAAWFSKHRMESVWLLADHRFFLFPTVNCPCFIGRHSRLEDGEAGGDFEFVTPKVERTDPRAASLPVQPEDQKIVSQPALVAAAQRGEAATAWKQSHWGTPRDARLLERLLKLSRLHELATRPPRMKRTKDHTVDGARDAPRTTRWWAGAGLQPMTESDRPQGDEEVDSGKTKPWPIWWGQRHRMLTAQSDPEGYIVEESETPQYGIRGSEVRRTLAPELTRPPLVLVNKAVTKAFFSNHPLLFQDDFQSIAGLRADEDELLFLTAFLDSDLAQYLLFHTTANIGIERDIARLEEILALPFPLPDESSPADSNRRRIISKCAEAIRSLQMTLRKDLLRDAVAMKFKTRAVLNKHLADYFGLSEWERELVTDTVEIFRPSSTPASPDSDKLITAKPSKPAHREAYAETLVRTFGAWTRGKKTLWAQGHLAAKSGLALLTLGTGGKPREYSEKEATTRVEEIVAAIRESSAQEGGAVFRKLRGFAYYEADRVHLLKPLARRHWTRTAALNDADEILARMMEEGGWGV